MLLHTAVTVICDKGYHTIWWQGTNVSEVTVFSKTFTKLHDIKMQKTVSLTSNLT
jgi:hypothetical protein